MLKQGEAIVHPRYGAGRVIGTQTLTMGGIEKRYYAVELVDDQSTVLVPADQVENIGIRTDIIDLKTIETILHNTPHILSEDYRIRQAEIRDKMNSGKPGEMLQALRDLCWHEWTKKLTPKELDMKTQLLDVLTQELSLRVKFDLPSARSQMQTMLHHAMHTHEAGLQGV